MGLTDADRKQISMSRFYTHDGTWRTAEPSWRVMMVQRENVCGFPSDGLTLNNPSLLNTLQPGRRLKMPEAPTLRPIGDPDSAAAAAAAFCALNFKDQKLSGFANETLCHTAVGAHDPARWGRLGIMTRERLVESDRFGDIRIPDTRPVTASGDLKPATFPKQAAFPVNDPPPRPANAESSGFTRRPLLHSATSLTGGFTYSEPEVTAAATPDNVKVVGNKLPTGFTLNNIDVAAGDSLAPAVDGAHWRRTSIGSTGTGSNWYDGAGARVTKYGEMRPRKLAPHETGGDVITLRVEMSGFSRNKLHERDHVRQNWTHPSMPEPTVERKLQASQLALRMMADPIEFTTPHAHKQRR
jgi:hypothetical protein